MVSMPAGALGLMLRRVVEDAGAAGALVAAGGLAVAGGWLLPGFAGGLLPGLLPGGCVGWFCDILEGKGACDGVRDKSEPRNNAQDARRTVAQLVSNRHGT